MVSRQCVLFHLLQDQISGQSSCHNGCIGVASHQCVFSHALQNHISQQKYFTMNALEWVFTSVYSHMVCKFTTLYKALFTITAMVWLLASRSSLVLYKNILNCFEKNPKQFQRYTTSLKSFLLRNHPFMPQKSKKGNKSS